MTSDQTNSKAHFSENVPVLCCRTTRSTGRPSCASTPPSSSPPCLPGSTPLQHAGQSLLMMQPLQQQHMLTRATASLGQMTTPQKQMHRPQMSQQRLQHLWQQQMSHHQLQQQPRGGRHMGSGMWGSCHLCGSCCPHCATGWRL